MQIFFARQCSHYNVTCGGFGETPEAAIAAAKLKFDFIKFVSIESEAFFDTEAGIIRWPEAKGIPPANLGFSAQAEKAVMTRSEKGSTDATLFHRDHRGE